MKLSGPPLGSGVRLRSESTGGTWRESQQRRKVSGLAADFIRDHLKSAFRRRTRCVARWLPPERRADHEAGDRHLGIVRRGLEFRPDHQLLSAARFRRGSGAGAASAFFATLRPWLLGLSVALIGLGFWHEHRAKQCSVPGRRTGMVLVWVFVAVVLGLVLFPAELA